MKLLPFGRSNAVGTYRMPLWTKALLWFMAFVTAAGSGYGIYRGVDYFQRYFSRPPVVRDYKPGDNQPVASTPTVIPATPTSTPDTTVVAPVPLETRLLNRLYEEVPEIKEFPDRVAKAVVAQVKTDFYDRGLVQDEQKLWQYVAPTVRQGLSALSRTDYVRRDGNGNVVATISYSSSGLPKVDYSGLSDEQIGHVLLNERLGEVNLLTGEKGRFSLDTAVLNTTPVNEEKFFGRVLIGIVDGKPRYQDVVVNLNGLSPVERITGLALQDYLDKKSDRYVRAIRIAKDHHDSFRNLGDPKNPGIWVKSNRTFQKEVDQMLLDGEDFYAFSYGYPHALYLTGVIPDHPTGGQVAPFYTVTLANAFGMPAEVVRAIYPISLTGEHAHDEPYLFAPDLPNGDPLFHQHFGFWNHLAPFEEDYEGTQWTTPSAWVLGVNDETVKQLIGINDIEVERRLAK